MNILADHSLPGLTENFPKPFKLTTYTNADEVPDLLENQDVLLCRSTLKVNKTLLGSHQLKYIATASSGTDHIDHAYVQARGMQIIDAKGSNATSVADYVMASLAYLTSQQLIAGKQVGIIGMGKVGTKVHQRLRDLNFTINGYDPLKAMQDQAFQSCTLEELYTSDILCVHAELHDTHPYPSLNLINRQFFNQLKANCIIINASRGGIVNEVDLVNHSSPLIYCTDVYLNEPNIDKKIVDKATLCTPHIAGHSLEAKYAAVAQVSEQLHKILNLKMPQFAVPDFNQEHYAGSVLSLYNPINETLKLKQAQDLKAAFIQVRKEHNFRHDFEVYGLGN